MSAIISDCEQYRYRLDRTWGPGPTITWIMLNPSTADASADDPTIRKCKGFSAAWGAGSIAVVNLFALRATDPGELARHPEPVGPDNDHYIAEACQVGKVVIAWGTHPMSHSRGKKVIALLESSEIACLGLTKMGHPRHPLYVPYAQPLISISD